MRLFGILFGCALAAAAAGPETILIRDADIYPVSGQEIKGASLLIQNGKIAEIGTKIVAPKGARIVEAKGLRIYPGMIDSGTELGLSEVPAERVTVDTGEIGQFEPQLRALSAVNVESEHFGVVRVNGITSAITVPAIGGGRGGAAAGERQLIAGQAALIHTDGWNGDDMAILRSAAMTLLFPTLGSGGRRGGMTDMPTEAVSESAAGSAADARRTFDEQVLKLSDFFDAARRYAKAKAAKDPGFETDLRYEAMIPVLERKIPVTITAARANLIHEAIQWAKAQNVRLVILQPTELGKAAAELKAEDVPVIFGRVLALPNSEDASYDQAFTLPLEAYKAGVKFAFGTFTNEFVRNIPYQAATAVAFGLPYDEALKAITLYPAQIWGVADQIGSIEKGKIADLIVTDGDPLEIQTQLKHLFIKGKEVALTNKQTRLNEKYLSRN